MVTGQVRSAAVLPDRGPAIDGRPIRAYIFDGASDADRRCRRSRRHRRGHLVASAPWREHRVTSRHMAEPPRHASYGPGTQRRPVHDDPRPGQPTFVAASRHGTGRPPPMTVTATGSIPRVRVPEPADLRPGRQRGAAGLASRGAPGVGAPAGAAVAGVTAGSAPAALHHEFVGDWGFQPIVPERADRGARLFLVISFWFMLAVSIELWWLDTPWHSVHGTAAVLTESGRVTGMAAGFFLLTQILLMSRISVLERSVGSHDLLVWHRDTRGRRSRPRRRSRCPDHARLRR